MTTIVKAANAAEFLTLIPRLLGFHPARSLVLVPFAGKRTLGAMRVDLPDESPGTDVDCAASTLIGMVCKVAAADAVAVVSYTDRGFAEAGIPHGELVGAVRNRADACGLRVVDALCVAADAWGSYLDSDCPAAGWPLAELGIEPPGLDGLPEPVGDQLSGTELPVADLVEKEHVGAALRALAAAAALLCGVEDETVTQDVASVTRADADSRVDPRALAAVCGLDDAPVLFEQALTWDAADLAPYDAAILIWCLSRPALRDIALVEWCGGLSAGDEALTAQLRWEAGEEYPAHLAMHMWGEGEQPEPSRLTAALELARRLAAVAPRSDRAGILATCGWLAWAMGRSTHAAHYAELACEIEPEHGLGEIVRSFVHAGHLPEWAFERPVPRR
jgi:hypothetical protein